MSLCWAHRSSRWFYHASTHIWEKGTLVLNGCRFFNCTWVALQWATSWENLFIKYANNKDVDQPAHLCSLISGSVVCCLDSIIPEVDVYKIPRGAGFVLYLITQLRWQDFSPLGSNKSMVVLLKLPLVLLSWMFTVANSNIQCSYSFWKW